MDYGDGSNSSVEKTTLFFNPGGGSNTETHVSVPSSPFPHPHLPRSDPKYCIHARRCMRLYCPRCSKPCKSKECPRTDQHCFRDCGQGYKGERYSYVVNPERIGSNKAIEYVYKRVIPPDFQREWFVDSLGLGFGSSVICTALYNIGVRKEDLSWEADVSKAFRSDHPEKSMKMDPDEHSIWWLRYYIKEGVDMVCSHDPDDYMLLGGLEQILSHSPLKDYRRYDEFIQRVVWSGGVSLEDAYWFFAIGGKNPKQSLDRLLVKEFPSLLIIADKCVVTTFGRRVADVESVFTAPMSSTIDAMKNDVANFAKAMRGEDEEEKKGVAGNKKKGVAGNKKKGVAGNKKEEEMGDKKKEEEMGDKKKEEEMGDKKKKEREIDFMELSKVPELSILVKFFNQLLRVPHKKRKKDHLPVVNTIVSIIVRHLTNRDAKVNQHTYPLGVALLRGNHMQIVELLNSMCLIPCYSELIDMINANELHHSPEAPAQFFIDAFWLCNYLTYVWDNLNISGTGSPGDRAGLNNTDVIAVKSEHVDLRRLLSRVKRNELPLPKPSFDGVLNRLVDDMNDLYRIYHNLKELSPEREEVANSALSLKKCAIDVMAGESAYNDLVLPIENFLISLSKDKEDRSNNNLMKLNENEKDQLCQFIDGSIAFVEEVGPNRDLSAMPENDKIAFFERYYQTKKNGGTLPTISVSDLFPLRYIPEQQSGDVAEKVCELLYELSHFRPPTETPPDTIHTPPTETPPDTIHTLPTETLPTETPPDTIHTPPTETPPNTIHTLPTETPPNTIHTPPTETLPTETPPDTIHTPPTETPSIEDILTKAVLGGDGLSFGLVHNILSKRPDLAKHVANILGDMHADDIGLEIARNTAKDIGLFASVLQKCHGLSESQITHMLGEKANRHDIILGIESLYFGVIGFLIDTKAIREGRRLDDAVEDMSSKFEDNESFGRFKIWILLEAPATLLYYYSSRLGNHFGRITGLKLLWVCYVREGRTNYEKWTVQFIDFFANDGEARYYAIIGAISPSKGGVCYGIDEFLEIHQRTVKDVNQSIDVEQVTKNFHTTHFVRKCIDDTLMSIRGHVSFKEQQRSSAKLTYFMSEVAEILGQDVIIRKRPNCQLKKEPTEDKLLEVVKASRSEANKNKASNPKSRAPRDPIASAQAELGMLKAVVASLQSAATEQKQWHNVDNTFVAMHKENNGSFSARLRFGSKSENSHALMAAANMMMKEEGDEYMYDVTKQVTIEDGIITLNFMVDFNFEMYKAVHSKELPKAAQLVGNKVKKDIFKVSRAFPNAEVNVVVTVDDKKNNGSRKTYKYATQDVRDQGKSMDHLLYSPSEIGENQNIRFLTLNGCSGLIEYLNSYPHKEKLVPWIAAGIVRSLTSEKKINNIYLTGKQEEIMSKMGNSATVSKVKSIASKEPEGDYQMLDLASRLSGTNLGSGQDYDITGTAVLLCHLKRKPILHYVYLENLEKIISIAKLTELLEKYLSQHLGLPVFALPSYIFAGDLATCDGASKIGSTGVKVARDVYSANCLWIHGQEDGDKEFQSFVNIPEDGGEYSLNVIPLRKFIALVLFNTLTVEIVKTKLKFSPKDYKDAPDLKARFVKMTFAHFAQKNDNMKLAAQEAYDSICAVMQIYSKDPKDHGSDYEDAEYHGLRALSVFETRGRCIQGGQSIPIEKRGFFEDGVPRTKFLEKQRQEKAGGKRKGSKREASDTTNVTTTVKSNGTRRRKR